MGQVVAVANVLTQRLAANSDTSSSSVAIGTGNKTFTTAGFYEWAVGMWVTVTSGANPANYMFGQVTSYNTSTEALVVDVDSVGGSGTFSDWTIALSAYSSVGNYLVAADIGVTVQGYDADTVFRDVQNNFSKQQYFGNVALTDAATIAWNAQTAQVATFTFVSSNRTMGAPTNLVNGAFYALAVIQNAGSNTLTWNAVFKWASGSAPTLSTAAGAKDYFTFRSDGTNLYEQGRSQAVA
jgi:hypothetical protein